MSEQFSQFGVDDHQSDGHMDVRCVDRTGQLITELPSATVQEIVWELNGAGSARIKCPTSDPRLLELALAKTELQVWRNDQLWWWGVPWRCGGNHVELTFECEGLLSYFSKRYVTYTGLDYTNLDQHVIGWNLLSHAQAGVDEDLNIVAGAFSNSGKIRSRRYIRAEHPNILDSLAEFPTVQDGFDYEIVTYGDGRREWWPRYPRKGTTRSNLVLEWGRNITTYEYSEDALNMANLVYATGGISGEIKLENNFRNDAAAAEYGEMHAIVSEGSELDVNWLQDRAQQETEERSYPIVVPSITVKNIEGVEVVETLQTGDVVPVSIEHGRVYVEGLYRIHTKTWNSNDTLKLEVAPEAA